MAARIIVFAIFLTLVFRATFSLPISVQSLQKVKLSESEAILRFDDEIKLVQSLRPETVLNDLTNFNSKHKIKRTKRYVAKTWARCPKDTIEYGNQCLTPEQYAEYNEDDGINEVYTDYEAER